MKANRKFLNRDDEAVSPVIAVILMVAITVVLAATVYVWVSGFGSQSSAPAKSLALSSSGALSDNHKNYTVASATPGLKWSDITLTLNGDTLNYDDTIDTAGAANSYCVVSTATSCATETSLTTVQAGQKLNLYDTALNGQELRILDSQANAVILTLVVG